MHSEILARWQDKTPSLLAEESQRPRAHQAALLLSMMEAAAHAARWTPAELADLLTTHVWADLDITSPQSALVGEAIERLQQPPQQPVQPTVHVHPVRPWWHTVLFGVLLAGVCCAGMATITHGLLHGLAVVPCAIGLWMLWEGGR